MNQITPYIQAACVPNRNILMLIKGVWYLICLKSKKKKKSLLD